MISINYQVTIPQWISLPYSIRLRLQHMFRIPRSSGTEVMDGTVITDGHTHEDLKHISVDAMQAYIGSESRDFYSLFEATVGKVEAELEAEEEALRLQAEEERQKQVSNRKDAIMNTMANLAVQAENLSVEFKETAAKKPKK